MPWCLAMLTLSSMLNNALRHHPERLAIADTEGTFTWREHIDRVARAAAVLGDFGVRPRDRFAILSRNSFRYCELLHAGYWMGAIPVPVNQRLAPPEIASILANAEVKLVAVEDAVLGLLDNGILAGWRDHTLALPTDSADAANSDYETRLAVTTPVSNYESAETDDAIILHTSGTGGRSKGLRLTHRNVVSNGLQCGLAMQIRSDDVYLHTASMVHSADLLGTGFTLAGAGHTFLKFFSPRAFFSAIQEFRATATMVAPTLAVKLLQSPDRARFDLSALRLLIYGSAPMAPRWIKQLYTELEGVDIVQGYGLSETAPLVSLFGGDDHRAALAAEDEGRLSAAGRPLVGVDLRIVDTSAVEVPTNEPGEVVVRGPNVSPGYFKLPELDRQVHRDGWFHTGDVGKVDQEGFLYILDRQKDVIISRGEKVYSSEVETLLLEHPAVNEVAIVGLPDPEEGEILFAAIACLPGRSLTKEEVRAHCRGRVALFKIPRRVAILEELPKNAAGKILKDELKSQFSDSREFAKSC